MTLSASIQRLAKLQAEHDRVEAISNLPDDIRQVTCYGPRLLQSELDILERRFNVLVVHRRFGKTVREINKLIERAVECPFEDGRYIYGAPTYSQAEDIAWVHLENYAKKVPGAYAEKGKLAYWIPTRLGSWARIRLYGFDSPKQRVRGLYCDGAVLDEFPWIPPSAWSQQIRPMLMDENRRGNDRLGRRNQWADFIFTPQGRDHAFTLYRNACLWRDGKGVGIKDPLTGEDRVVMSDDWFAACYKASETGILSPEEMDAACAEMDMLPGSSKYLQEMECSFDAAVEGAIFSKQLEAARNQGRIATVPYNELAPVNTAWDLGWDDATAIWFFQQVGVISIGSMNYELVRVIDYLEDSGQDLAFYRDAMAKKGYSYGYHLLPADVEVHDLGTGKSRRQILAELGLQVHTVPKYSPKVDGIPAAQNLLARCVFDEEKCAVGLDRLALYRREYDEKNQIFRAEPVHNWASHGASALMQLAMGIRKSPTRGSYAPVGEFG
jgi:hypothetical protein